MKDSKLNKYIVQRPGLSRDKRVLESLSPEYFMADERSREEYLRVLNDYSALLTYYNERNIPDGTWSNFFKNNITYQLVLIRNYNTISGTELAERIISRVKSNVSFHNEDEWINQFIIYPVTNINHINNWYFVTQSIKEFRDEIEKLIVQHLNKEYSKLLTIVKALEKYSSKVTPLIRKLDLRVPWVYKEHSSDAYNELSLSDLLLLAADVYKEIVLYTEVLKNSAGRYLDEHLNHSGQVQPHMGLILGFLDLYKNAQDEINSFTERHLNHYYADVLKEKPSDLQANYVNLCFELIPKQKELLLERGRKFSAGEDAEGNEIVYSLCNDLVVNQARIMDVKMLVNQEDALVNIDRRQNKLEVDTFIIDRSLQGNKGLSQEQIAAYNENHANDFGLAIASPILILEEGYRKIKFFFHTQKQSLVSFIEDVKALYPVDEFRIPEDVESIIDKLFSIRYTIEEEYFNIPHDKTEYRLLNQEKEGVGNIIEITCLLEPHDPATSISALERYKDAAAQGLPVFEFHLNPAKSYLYKYFSKVKIESIEIDTEVLGLKNLIVQNDYGVLDINAPMQIFGPVPKLGSSLYVGHKSIFNHLMTDLCISFEWMDVPDSDNGFEEYYQGYSYIDSNEIFKAKLSYLHNKKWLPEEDQQIISLFEDVYLESDDTPVNNHRRIDTINVGAFTFDQKIGLNKDKSFNTNSTNGFVKLELCYPPNAFGHKEYPDVLKKAINRNILKKKDDPYPNEAYTPNMKNFSVDYFASHYINLKKGLEKDDFIFQLAPYGFRDIKKSAVDTNSFFPKIHEGAEFVIGFENLHTPGTLSLLVQINEILISAEQINENVEWSVLSENEWRILKQNEIISDTTKHLIQSGIISFDFHDKVITETNSVLPKGIVWLRCQSSRGINLLNTIQDLRCQSSKAELVSKHEALPALPSYTIADLQKPDKRIKVIEQPYPTFGGKNKETPADFRIRLSERLRHKQRASSLWDIEHLILEKFPFLYKVKCYNNHNDTFGFEPGNILVVVIPSGDSSSGMTEPVISYSKIKEIETFITEYTSPFVNVCVRNPYYEKVQVKLDVKFNEGYDEGYYKKVLNDDIRKSLSPWMFSSELRPDFGVVIHGSAILNFIQNIDYVDFVENFSVFHIVGNEIINKGYASMNDVVVKPSTPLSILISEPNHYIGLVSKSTPDGEGVNDMILETDFMVENQNKLDYLSEYGVEMNSIGFDFEIKDENQETDDDSIYIIKL